MVRKLNKQIFGNELTHLSAPILSAKHLWMLNADALNRLGYKLKFGSAY